MLLEEGTEREVATEELPLVGGGGRDELLPALEVAEDDVGGGRDVLPLEGGLREKF